VSGHRHNGPSFWTPERVSVLRGMYRDGVSDREIGEALGVTANAVRVRRHHLGLVCRRIKRTSIRDYETIALIEELERRLGALPTLRARKRELDPAMAGGIHLM
jgi:hypothetical protein